MLADYSNGGPFQFSLVGYKTRRLQRNLAEFSKDLVFLLAEVPDPRRSTGVASLPVVLRRVRESSSSWNVPHNHVEQRIVHTHGVCSSGEVWCLKVDLSDRSTSYSTVDEYATFLLTG